jgi:hypothetical protein
MDELIDIKLSRLIRLTGASEVTFTSKILASRVTKNPYSSRVNLPFSVLTISFNNFALMSACPKDFREDNITIHIKRRMRFRNKFFICFDFNLILQNFCKSKVVINLLNAKTEDTYQICSG